jgi:leucyl aminopeptidase
VEFSINSTGPEKSRGACLIVGVLQSRELTAAGNAIDRASGGYLRAIMARGDMDGKLGATLTLHNVPNIAAERVMLVGLGSADELDDRRYRGATRAAMRALAATGTAGALSWLTEAPVRRRDGAWKVMHAAAIAADSDYRFTRMKSKADDGAGALKKLELHAGERALDGARKALRQAAAVAHGAALTKDLGNLPSNVCTPSYLAAEARALAKSHPLTVQVLEKKDMEKLGMGALLAVAQGSAEPPKLISLQYQGAAKSQPPVVLVGKGVTFDTGGISLKPPAEMDEMKYDMCGAASVLGTLRAVAELKLRINVVGLIPTTENMPGGRAIKPGDVVKTLSGQTVEILNTDAEGRLILCDALTYAERFKPAAVIDIATLTGACVIALGHVAAGLFANDDALARELLAAGETTFDRAWHMPLWEDYQDSLSSNFADFANIGGRPAGSITAACYLSRFTKNYKWAHLDIAGVAWKSGKEKGATGRPVPLLTQFLANRAANHRR